MKNVKLQRFYKNPKEARKLMHEGLTNPHSDLSRDFGGMEIKSIRKSRKRGNEPNNPVNGALLYDITLTKRRK